MTLFVLIINNSINQNKYLILLSGDFKGEGIILGIFPTFFKSVVTLVKLRADTTSHTTIKNKLYDTQWGERYLSRTNISVPSPNKSNSTCILFVKFRSIHTQIYKKERVSYHESEKDICKCLGYHIFICTTVICFTRIEANRSQNT